MVVSCIILPSTLYIPIAIMLCMKIGLLVMGTTQLGYEVILV